MNATSLLSHLRGALAATFALAVVCCGIYPLVVFAVAQSAFPHQANGSLIIGADGVIHGSARIGQPFSATNYFHPRPSAAGNGYDAVSSGGSNFGPTSKKLRAAIKDRIDAYRAENGLALGDPVPADAVTASGSGLDPHISAANAELQVARVSRARGLDVTRVRELVGQYTEGPDLGFLGEPGVNVLRLNLALDAITSPRGK